jgi:hypothetical protein
MMSAMVVHDAPHSPGTVLLHWIPLGAGTRLPIVRWSGRGYERLIARREGRRPQSLFHAAVQVYEDSVCHTLEVAPAWGRLPADRGVVVTGPVGLRQLGRSVLFRYEVRCWPGGTIPDMSHAVGPPTVITQLQATAHAVLRAASDVPSLIWGRDELGCRDMWNSNSVVAFALTRAGISCTSLTPPQGGRAPGWRAGIVAAGQAKASTGGHEHTK